MPGAPRVSPESRSTRRSCPPRTSTSPATRARKARRAGRRSRPRSGRSKAARRSPSARAWPRSPPCSRRSPRARRWSDPAAGYAWTRSLLARHADAGRIRAGRRRIRPTPPATLAACEGAALLYVETPSNPLVEIAELDALCAGAHERGAVVAVDGTFASPLLQRTLSQGADFAIQSATKFIGGHSDLLLGTVTSTEHAEALHHIRAQLGALPGALEAYLALRGLRTLPVRLEVAQRNAQTLAERLRRAVPRALPRAARRPGPRARHAAHGRLWRDALLRASRRRRGVSPRPRHHPREVASAASSP